MNTTVNDIMVRSVVTVSAGATVGSVRDTMLEQGVHALPVTDETGHPVGMITANDLLENFPDDTLIARIVDPKVYVIPRYEGTHIAARIMRNHKIHHLVVTDEGVIVGIVSSFDLLKLVEDHRFTMKNPPSQGNRRGKG
ncbi:MAG: CBS domain-containing protein [Verrucomicrobiales bacterium]|nr:CBS domain-containing protein [Verrucomicrobiae bacterium]